MKLRHLPVIALTSVSFVATAGAGISDNNRIPSGDALLLGGEQSGWIDIDGQNRGAYNITLILKNGTGEKVVGSVAPGKGFYQSVPKGQVLVLKNTSNEGNAKVYWHISRYSSKANPRYLSQTEN